jgi:hypothetical protein
MKIPIVITSEKNKNNPDSPLFFAPLILAFRICPQSLNSFMCRSLNRKRKICPRKGNANIRERLTLPHQQPGSGHLFTFFAAFPFPLCLWHFRWGRGGECGHRQQQKNNWLNPTKQQQMGDRSKAALGPIGP